MSNNEEAKKLEKLINLSIGSFDSMLDVNTVIGRPITLPSGTQIIPFTKVTFGFLSGGGEYGSVKVIEEDGKAFAGGTGNIVSMKPCGFLIDDGKECKLLKVSDEPLDNLIDKAENLLSKIGKK